MTIALLVVAFLLFWAGVTLILEGRERSRVDLVDRLWPYVNPPTVIEEAEEWLRGH